MREVLLPLFAANGVPSPLAVWTPAADAIDPVMSWMLAWPSYDARRAGWAALYPQWETAKRARGGDEFVTRTTLTLVDPLSNFPLHFPAGEEACESAWLVHPSVGYGTDWSVYCEKTLAPAARRVGAAALSACTMQFGPLPEALLFISWPDAATRDAGTKELAPLLAFPLTPDGGRIIPGEGEVTMLERAGYLPTWQSQPLALG
jgi:hypothetical protein